MMEMIPPKYLPLGSVVLLKDGSKEIMIYGRRQTSIADGKIYDYIACLYPEGNLSQDYMYLFNHQQIREVLFLGYAGKGEKDIQERLKALE
jgi:hypothetical protein